MFAELDQRISKSGMVTTLESEEPPSNMSKKMLIIMPESCETPTDIHHVAPTMKCHAWIPFKANRGGKKERDYGSTVYSLDDPVTGRVNVFNKAVPKIELFPSTVKPKD